MEIDLNKLSFSIETRWINETDSYISKKKTALVDKPRNNKRKRRKKITWKSSGLRFALSREWSESYPQREPSFKALVSTLTSPLSASVSWVFSIFFLLLLSQCERERERETVVVWNGTRILTGSDDCLSLWIFERLSRSAFASRF